MNSRSCDEDGGPSLQQVVDATYPIRAWVMLRKSRYAAPCFGVRAVDSLVTAELVHHRCLCV
eukprot:56338-Eustigmatos_ZCMA.PRE.1